MVGILFTGVATPPEDEATPPSTVLPDGTVLSAPTPFPTPPSNATSAATDTAVTPSPTLAQVTVEAVAPLPSEATADLSIDPARAAAFARLTKVYESCTARGQKLSLLKQATSEKGTALDLRLDSVYDAIGVARGALENDLKDAQGMLVTNAASGAQEGAIVGPQALLAKARKDVDSLVQLGKKLTEEEQAVESKILEVSRHIDELLSIEQTVTSLLRSVENREGSPTGAEEAQKAEDADARASREFEQISATASGQIDELIRKVDATAAEVKVLQKTLDQEGVDVRALMKQWSATRANDSTGPSEGSSLGGAKKKSEAKPEGVTGKGRARTAAPDAGVPQQRRAKHSSLVDSVSAAGDIFWDGARVVGAYLSRVIHMWYHIATERTTLFIHDDKEYYDPVLEQIRLEQNEAYARYRILLHEEKEFQLKKELFDAREKERREALSAEAVKRDPVRFGSPCASWGDVLFDYVARICSLLVRFFKALL